MKRRTFLLTAAASVLSPRVLLAKRTNSIKQFGWIPGHQEPETLAYQCKGTDSELRCLWEDWEAFHGSWIPRKQYWGDCVAQASGGAVDLLTAIEQHDYIAPASTDMIYAGGRHYFGDTYGPGMCGIWAMQWLSNYGKLLRINYGHSNHWLPRRRQSYNLTHYSKSTCLYWDRTGVPSALRALAKEHPVKQYNLVTTWEQCCDSIINGHPIVFCALMGAENSVRDQDGFITPEGQWAHAWLLAGVDNESSRPGACLLNSHGSWASGPKKLGQPDGSVWIDREYIEYHLDAMHDSYAIVSCTN